MHDHASHRGWRCNHTATRQTLIGLGDRVPSRKKRGQTFYSLCRACLRSPTTGSKLILAGQEEGAVSHPSSREANRSCRADFPVNDEFSCPLTAIRPDGQRLMASNRALFKDRFELPRTARCRLSCSRKRAFADFSVRPQPVARHTDRKADGQPNSPETN